MADEIISRKEARAQGLKHYFTGKPCVHGHVAKRDVFGHCIECERKRDRERYSRRYKRKRSIGPRETRPQKRRRLRAENPQKYLNAERKAQKDRCAYCHKKLGRGYHVDHIVPLARGGTNERRNIQITCKQCNHIKRDKDPIKFAQELGRLL